MSGLKVGLVPGLAPLVSPCGTASGVVSIVDLFEQRAVKMRPITDVKVERKAAPSKKENQWAANLQFTFVHEW